MKSVFVAIAVCVLMPSLSYGWDPIGDLKNPGRIIDNARRETENVIQELPKIPDNIRREAENFGSEIDRIRREAMAVASAPALAQWLQTSRDTARGGAQPIPHHIREAMTGFFDQDILNRTAYKIGDGGVINLANLSINYGDARAVTLIDTVVFSDLAGANDVFLWAHELAHVLQFRNWGTNDFAIRYLRSWNGVENEATSVANQFAERYRPAPFPQPVPSPQQVPQFPQQVQLPDVTQYGRMCVTNWGPCPMNLAMPIYSSCFCPSPNGMIPGAVR